MLRRRKHACKDDRLGYQVHQGHLTVTWRCNFQNYKQKIVENGSINKALPLVLDDDEYNTFITIISVKTVFQGYTCVTYE